MARGFFGEIFGGFFTEEKIESDASAAAGTAARGIALDLSDARDVHASQGLRVFGEGAIGAYYEDVAQLVRVAGANFLDARIIGASRLIGAHHQFDLGGDFGVNGRKGYRIKAAGGPLLEAYRRGLGRAAGDQGCGAGRVQNALRRKIVGVGVAGTFADDYPNAASRRNSLRCRLDHGFIHAQRSRGKILKIKVGIVAAR